MADTEQKSSRFWWVALGIALGMLIGSPRLSVRIVQCDSEQPEESRNVR